MNNKQAGGLGIVKPHNYFTKDDWSSHQTELISMQILNWHKASQKLVLLI